MVPLCRFIMSPFPSYVKRHSVLGMSAGKIYSRVPPPAAGEPQSKLRNLDIPSIFRPISRPRKNSGKKSHFPVDKRPVFLYNKQAVASAGHYRGGA